MGSFGSVQAHHVYSDTVFQAVMGGHHMQNFAVRGLDGDFWPSDCLLACRNPPTSQKLSGIHDRQPSLPVKGLAIWPQSGTKNIHKVGVGSGLPVTQRGHISVYILGQLAESWLEFEGISNSHHHNIILATRSLVWKNLWKSDLITCQEITWLSVKWAFIHATLSLTSLGGMDLEPRQDPWIQTESNQMSVQVAAGLQTLQLTLAFWVDFLTST